MIVLHVDDNPLDRFVVEQLNRSYNIEYIHTNLQSKSMEYLGHSSISLILVGENIADSTGLSVLESLNLSEYNKIPLVLIVDTENSYHLNHYSSLGVIDCIFRPEMLAIKIYSYIENVHNQQEIYKDMQNLSVAVIDDSNVALRVIHDMLKEENIRNVKLYNDPRLLLENYQDFDVFFVDVIMPGITGDKLIRIIRRKSPNSIIITMSAIDNVKTISNVLSAGSDDYVVKPFNRDELLSRLRTNYRSFALMREL